MFLVIGVTIVALLASLLISIAFYFTKNLDEKKKSNIRMFLIAFLLPFSNMLLFLLLSNNSGLGFAITGLFYMVVILPICLLISIVYYFFSKNSFYIKTTLLTFLFGVVLIFLLSFLYTLFDYIKTVVNLTEYNPTIEYIENYKIKNGFYPDNLSSFPIKTKYFPYYKYTTKDNKREYILSVSKYKYFNEYTYCSSLKYEGCHAKDGYPISYRKIGKWIEYINSD